MNENSDLFVSVDVETSGPIPGEYSLLQIGACDVHRSDRTFSCFLKPINDNAIDEALNVTGLSMKTLKRDGVEPSLAMENFGQWIAQTANSQEVIFVGLNAPFDWSFINYYFHRYTGRNPFGHAALDIKSFYMGATHCQWKDTSADVMSRTLKVRRHGRHDALQDAIFQAELFRLMHSKRRPVSSGS